MLRQRRFVDFALSDPAPLLIRGGNVVTAGGVTELDVLVRNGHIVEMGISLEAPDVVVIDARGCWVGPAFVDIHTHLREPGQEHKEDIATGSAAAAAGGYTAVVAMPNTSPAIDSRDVARRIAERGREVGLVEVVPSGTITVGRSGETLAPLSELWAEGVRVFTDDGDTVADAGLLRTAMATIADLGGVVSQHAVDSGLARNGHMHEGDVSVRLGIGGVPAIAEEIIIQRDVALARLTGVRYHVQHVSTEGALGVIAAAKAEGLPVTAEVTPHHLNFYDTDVEAGGTLFKMMPPLRTRADVAALRAALASGLIDAVATDHAPHAPDEKATAFEEAPPGVTGLEWAATAVNTSVALDIERFFDRLSFAPARIAGIDDRHGRVPEPGGIANLVVFDPAAEWTPSTSRSRSKNSPYLGRTWRGRVRHTVYAGVHTYSAGGTG